MRSNSDKVKIQQVLGSVPKEEFDYFINRYTGARNELLCKKTYGVIITAKDVADEIIERMLTSSPDKID